MDWQERIEKNPEVLVGKPVIRGTRLSVELILELAAGGWSVERILRNYPGISKEDVQACFAYASHLVQQERRESNWTEQDAVAHG